MPKTRQQKEEILATATDRLRRSQAAVFVNISQVKVDQMEKLRDALFEGGLQLQVAKNNILKIALDELKIELPQELLDRPLGVIYSYDDPVAGAKTTQPFVKEFEALEVVGGLVNGQFVSTAQVSALAALPGREQLLGQLVGTLAAPISSFMNVLSGNTRGLVQVLSQIQAQKAA